MTEIATIARPYAEALFQAERSNLPLAQEWLDDLAVVAADDRLNYEIGRRRVGKECRSRWSPYH